MNTETIWIILATVGALALIRAGLIVVLSGGDIGRVGLTIRGWWRTVLDARFATKVDALLTPPPAKDDKPARPSGVPLRMLALLQRDGRLLDFLLEDIQGYTDDQIGHAVRDIHEKCQEALREHLVLEPVLPQPEGETVEVAPGFDPSAIRLTGNVTGNPPFRGTLKHQGWRVKELKLNPPPEGQDELVLQSAEVELP
jgi:hypothetical protein